MLFFNCFFFVCVLHEQDYELFDVDNESVEFMEVEILFHASLRAPQFRIQRIQRVQNPHHWKTYQLYGNYVITRVTVTDSSYVVISGSVSLQRSSESDATEWKAGIFRSREEVVSRNSQDCHESHLSTELRLATLW